MRSRQLRGGAPSSPPTAHEARHAIACTTRRGASILSAFNKGVAVLLRSPGRRREAGGGIPSSLFVSLSTNSSIQPP
eukprot:4893863-Prymnesium_polylepis.1